MISPEALQAMLGQPTTPDQTPLPPDYEDEAAEQPEGMSDDELEAAVKRLVERARDYMDHEVMPSVRRSWRYYHGEVDASPMGLIGTDAQGQPVYEGSRVVITECRDTMQALMPDLFRVFQSVDQVVKFLPTGKEDVEQAEQATDYCNAVFWEQPEVDQFLEDALLDWGVKYAAARVWWEPQNHEETYGYEWLNEWSLNVLQQDEEIVDLQGTKHTLQVWPQQMYDPTTGQWHMEPQYLNVYTDVTATRRVTNGKICIELLPQEELLIDGDAQKLEQCAVLGTRCMRRVSDVVEMGVPYEEVIQHATKTYSREAGDNETRHAREGGSGSGTTWTGSTSDLATAWVRVVDVKVRIDRDGDGIAEDWRVLLLGDPLKMVSARRDPGSDAIVVASPFRIPHKILGEGIVETMTDLQDQSTSAARRYFDNFARSINPRVSITSPDEKVVDSILEWHGGPILLNPGDEIGWHVVPFVGDQAFGMFDYIEQRRILRTGISPAAQGLDPNALKGQTTDGAQTIVAAPQSRVDSFARRFAGGFMRPLFQAMLKISVQYQDKPKVIRQRNEWVEVDPRAWNADMDAAPEVGLGTGTKIERMAAASLTLAKVEQYAAEGSMFYDPLKHQTALADYTNAIGIKDPARYFPEFSPEQMQQAQQQKAQQAEQQKQEAIQTTAAIEQAKVAPRIEADMQKAQLAAQGDMQKAQLAAQKDAHKAQVDAQGQLQKSHVDAAADAQDAALKHQQKMAEIQAHLAATLQAQADKHMREMIELKLELQLEIQRMKNKAMAGDGNITRPE